MLSSEAYGKHLELLSALEVVIQGLMSRMKVEGEDLISILSKLRTENHSNISAIINYNIVPVLKYRELIENLLTKENAWPQLPNNFLELLNVIAAEGERTRAGYPQFFEEVLTLPGIDDIHDDEIQKLRPKFHRTLEKYTASCTALLDYINSNPEVIGFRSEGNPVLKEFVLEFRKEMLDDAMYHGTNPELQKLIEAPSIELTHERERYLALSRTFEESITSTSTTSQHRQQRCENLSKRIAILKEKLSKRMSVKQREEYLESARDGFSRHKADRFFDEMVPGGLNSRWRVC